MGYPRQLSSLGLGGATLAFGLGAVLATWRHADLMAMLGISVGIAWVVSRILGSLSPRSLSEPGVLPPWGAALGVAGLGLTPILGIRFPGNLTPADVLLVVAFLLAVLTGRRDGLGIALPPRIWGAVGLIAISALLSSAFGGAQAGPNLGSAMRIGIAMVLVPAVALLVVRNSRRRDAVVLVWTGAAALSCLAALAEALGAFDPAATLGTQVFHGRTTGLATHPNHLGLAAAMAVPLALVLAIHGCDRLRRRAGWVAFPCLVAGVALSGSRAAALGLAIGLVPTIAHAMRRRSLVVVVMLGALAVAGLLGPEQTSGAGIDPGDRLLALAGRDPDSIMASNEGRVTVLSETLAAVRSGIGTGRGYADVGREHNIFLQFLLSGGVLGLAGLLLYISSPGRLRRNDPWVAALATSFIVWAAVGLFQNNVRDRFLFVPLGLLLAETLRGRGVTHAPGGAGSSENGGKVVR